MSKISKESAEIQLQLLLDCYCIDIDEVDTDDETDDETDDFRRAIKQARKKVIKYICNGLIEITETDNGVVVKQHLRFGDGCIEYGTINGKAKMEMRHAKDNDYYGKLYYLLGAISKKGFSVISRLENIDSMVAESIGAIFLMA